MATNTCLHIANRHIQRSIEVLSFSGNITHSNKCIGFHNEKWHFF